MTAHYKKTITPSEVLKNGQTATINRTTNAVRDHLQMLFGPIGPVGNVTVVISTEQLTDTAGSPIVTREGAGDDPNPGRARGC